MLLLILVFITPDREITLLKKARLKNVLLGLSISSEMKKWRLDWEIYALERISKESDEDYWLILEILTAYVRKNPSFEVVGNKKIMHFAMDIQANESTTSEVPEVRKIPLDIQAILTVLGRQKILFNDREPNRLNLSMTHLCDIHPCIL